MPDTHLHLTPEALNTSARAERVRLEAAARVLSAHFSDPVLSFPELADLNDLRTVIRFHLADWAASLR